jgi:hypothetical protein
MDLEKAKKKEILNKFDDVDRDALPQFEESADLLIQKHNGNAKMALQIALAYLNGHTKTSLPTKSLMTGRDGFTTLKMVALEGQLSEENCMQIIEKYWAPKFVEHVTTKRALNDGTGIIFDMRCDLTQGFLENY